MANRVYSLLKKNGIKKWEFVFSISLFIITFSFGVYFLDYNHKINLDLLFLSFLFALKVTIPCIIILYIFRYLR